MDSNTQNSVTGKMTSFIQNNTAKLLGANGSVNIVPHVIPAPQIDPSLKISQGKTPSAIDRALTSFTDSKLFKYLIRDPLYNIAGTTKEEASNIQTLQESLNVIQAQKFAKKTIAPEDIAFQNKARGDVLNYQAKVTGNIIGSIGFPESEAFGGPTKVLSKLGADAIDSALPGLETFVRDNPTVTEAKQLFDHLTQAKATGQIQPDIETSLINKYMGESSKFLPPGAEGVHPDAPQPPPELNALAKQFSNEQEYTSFMQDQVREGSALSKTRFSVDTPLSPQNLYAFEIKPTKPNVEVSPHELMSSPTKDIPPIINENNQIIDGNHRFQDMVNKGQKIIPVLKMSDQGFTLRQTYNSSRMTPQESQAEGMKNLAKIANQSSTPEEFMNNIGSLPSNQIINVIEKFGLHSDPAAGEKELIDFYDRIKSGGGIEPPNPPKTSPAAPESPQEPLIPKEAPKETPKYDYMKIRPLKPGEFQQYKNEDFLYKMLGDRNMGKAFINNYTKAEEKFWGKMPETQRIDFISRIMRGDFSKISPELRLIADSYRVRLDNVYNTIKNYGPISYRDNYFPSFWKNPKKAFEYFSSSGIKAKSPMQGSRSFLKQKIFNDIYDGIKAGLVPLTTNPAKLVAMAEINALKFTTAKQLFEDLDAVGSLKFVRLGAQAPEGFSKIDDSITKVYLPREGTVNAGLISEKGNLRMKVPFNRGGLTLSGEYWVPKDIARKINNAFSKNWLTVTKWGRAAIGAKNAMNALTLGLSAAHLTMESISTIASNLGLGLSKLGRFDILGAARDISMSPASPLLTYMKGSQLLKDAIRGDENAINILSEMHRSGLDPLRTSIYDITNEKEPILHAIRQAYIDATSGEAKKAIGDAIKIPGEIVNSTLYGIMKPIFNNIIPAFKMGAWMDLFQGELERNASQLEKGLLTRTELAKKVSRSIDNRFGEINYDTLFLNNTMKTAMTTGLRAAGWVIGVTRNFGSFGFDTLENLTGYSLVKSANGGYRYSKTYRPGFTPSMQYVVGLMAAVAVWNSIYQYLHTGMVPGEEKKGKIDSSKILLDLYYPRNGLKDSYGQPMRTTVLSQLKDPVAFFKDPLSSAWSKVSPELQITIDIMRNQDFWGNAVRDVSSPFYKQSLEVANYIKNQLTPFSLQQSSQVSRSGGSFEQQIESFFGQFPASPKLFMTPALKSQNDFIAHAKYLEGQIKGMASGSQERQKAQDSLNQEVDDFLKTLPPSERNKFRARLLVSGVTKGGSASSRRQALLNKMLGK